VCFRNSHLVCSITAAKITFENISVATEFINFINKEVVPKRLYAKWDMWKNQKNLKMKAKYFDSKQIRAESTSTLQVLTSVRT